MSKQVVLRKYPGSGPAMSLDGLNLVRFRRVGGRQVVDLVNDIGDVVLSGNIEWVLATSNTRNYYIENEEKINRGEINS